MNNSTGSPGSFLGADNFGGFGYGVGVSVGILLLITTITLASYYCTRTVDPAPQQRNIINVHRLGMPPGRGAAAGDAVVVNMGLDEDTIKSYPRLLYSEAKLRSSASTASCCSICLADYKGHDELRMIPDCGHLFHHECIDPWLRMHPTCPVCRTSPMPTPMSTPLAEVVPLASRRD
ncbi:RING-H2 finger protein ATL70 [Syzygium oleosum]|uniref:RING-H2 finger protein ATL70 n=1 Tax=Syzygium oleosum TaxID=219896 RepID=UPI0011D257E8|nr:RING-H2 finger protein ATL70 [Syzygium oleosum]